MKRNRSLSILRMMGALAVFALSAGFLGATAGITVMDPGYNDHDLYNGETHSIKWLQDGATPTTGKVRISLRNEASTQEVKVIALSAPNNGTYGWKVPMNLARNRYVVRIKLKGQDVYDDGSPFFVNPALRITQPPPGGNLVETKTYSITWTWEGPVPNSSLAIHFRDKAQTLPGKSIAVDVPINGPCSWTVPGDIPKGEYLVYFSLKDPNFTYSTPYNIILHRDLVKVKK